MLNKNEIAHVLKVIASLLEGQPVVEPPETTAAPAGEAPAPKRRGRPAATAPAESTATQTTPVETPATETKSTGGKSIEELQALIKPLIGKARGAEVKAVIAKYKPEGHDGDYLLSLIATRPEIHTAFVADIETLLM